MCSEKFNRFSGKELTAFGMRTIAGGDDPVLIGVEPKPKKVFPSSSSATNIRPGDYDGDFYLVVFELP